MTTAWLPSEHPRHRYENDLNYEREVSMTSDTNTQRRLYVDDRNTNFLRIEGESPELSIEVAIRGVDHETEKRILRELIDAFNKPSTES